MTARNYADGHFFVCEQCRRIKKFLSFEALLLYAVIVIIFTL